MALRLSSRSDVSSALKQIRATHQARSIKVRTYEGSSWNITGADISSKFDKLGINFWDKDDYRGIIVFDEVSQKVVLEFNLSGAPRNSATLAQIDGDTWLLHTGRFFQGRARPVWHEKVEVDGRSYFKVARTNDPEFARRVFQYHLSRGMILGDDDDEDVVQEQIANDTALEATEKHALIKARRGQGKYRESVAKIEGRCRVTGVSDLRLLRASHIKPWRWCETHQERLDGYNGLLLAPHIDHLFDQGYITFSDQGSMLLSPIIDPDQLRLLGLDTSLLFNAGPFHPLQLPYLEYHRTEVFHPK